MNNDDAIRAMNEEKSLEDIRTNIFRERKIIKELNSLYNHLINSEDKKEKDMISAHIRNLKNEFRKSVDSTIDSAENVSIVKQLVKPLVKTTEVKPVQNSQPKVIPNTTIQQIPEKKGFSLFKKRGKDRPDQLEVLTIQRATKKDKKVVKIKERKPSVYVKFASKTFGKYSNKLLDQGKFQTLKRDLVKGNMDFVPAAYISVIFFSTVLSFVASIFVALFFQFFSLTALPPFIVPAAGPMALRFFQVFWVVFFIPAVTFLFAYFYPFMEKSSIETKINGELPFAVVHMSSISSSMIEPSKIFGIIVATGEYPTLSKEFVKIQNEINVYGYDMVTALRNRAYNSPSKKLAELLNGLSTTITSGGGLPTFFEKRSQTLLFEHRLEKEKQAKASETFMDIYISAVIAAPMILMLLLMMMRISGLGITLSTNMISLIMILAVSLINILFLAFLHIKQPEGA